MKNKITDLKKELIKRAYKEGDWDCAMMLAWWAQKLEGVTYYDSISGSYDSKLSGLRWLSGKGNGNRTCADAVKYFLSQQWQQVAAEELKEGDLAEMADGNVAVVTEEGLMTCIVGQTGFMTLGFGLALGGWNLKQGGLK